MENKISGLLFEIESNLDSLNEQDAEGHIWWMKFKELAEKYLEEVPVPHSETSEGKEDDVLEYLKGERIKQAEICDCERCKSIKAQNDERSVANPLNQGDADGSRKGNQVEGKVYRWVRASERLPEKGDQFYICNVAFRNERNMPMLPIAQQLYLWEITKKWNTEGKVIEWLEEIPHSETSDKWVGVEDFKGEDGYRVLCLTGNGTMSVGYKSAGEWWMDDVAKRFSHYCYEVVKVHELPKKPNRIVADEPSVATVVESSNVADPIKKESETSEGKGEGE